MLKFFEPRKRATERKVANWPQRARRTNSLPSCPFFVRHDVESLVLWRRYKGLGKLMKRLLRRCKQMITHCAPFAQPCQAEAPHSKTSLYLSWAKHAQMPVHAFT